MFKLYIPVILAGFAILLTGCSWTAASTGVLEEKSISAIETKKRLSDLEARIAMNGPCLMTVGAYHRVLTDVEKRAVDWLCEGDMVTGDDVQFLKDYIELLERSRAAVNDGIPE